MQLPDALEITAQQWETMRAEAERCAPEEACGLVAGRCEPGGCRAEWIITTTNVLHSPARYRIDPYEQLAAFQNIDELGLELVGIFHSHPQGPDEPSPTDIAESYYPEVVYLIWSMHTGSWQCRGFTIAGTQENLIREIPLSVVD